MSTELNGHAFPDGSMSAAMQSKKRAEEVSAAERIELRNVLEQRAALGDPWAIDSLRLLAAIEALSARQDVLERLLDRAVAALPPPAA
jgi:hypothetical protein